jgi:predicted esterase YcpF (UPF0227 family)
MENTGPLLYIHGFASSGHSHKGQLLRKHFDEVYTPSLSHIPALAMETLEQFIDAMAQPPLLLGSSLGGYYALYLSQRLSLPAVLINPVVYIRPELEQLVGMQQHYYDGSRFEFTREHLHSLHDYHCPAPRSDRLLLMVQMGDEVIDHHQTLQHLPGTQQIIEVGGDHAFQGFENHMQSIRNFARASSSS